MPRMRNDPRMLLMGLAKFLAVVVLGTAAGAAIGLGLSALSGNGGDDESAAVAARPSPTPSPSPTSTATSKPKPKRKPKRAAETPTPTSTPTPSGPTTLRAVSAVLIPPASFGGSGQVRVRVRLPDGADDGPLLLSRGVETPVLRTDAGKRRSSILVFRPTPAVTARLTDTRKARLRVGPESVRLTLKLRRRAS